MIAFCARCRGTDDCDYLLKLAKEFEKTAKQSSLKEAVESDVT